MRANVKEHATLSAGASVDHGVEVECRKRHENRAADRGCVSRLVGLLHFVDASCALHLSIHEKDSSSAESRSDRDTFILKS